jgi:hypothetical protein
MTTKNKITAAEESALTTFRIHQPGTLERGFEDGWECRALSYEGAVKYWLENAGDGRRVSSQVLTGNAGPFEIHVAVFGEMPQVFLIQSLDAGIVNIIEV